jgi:hypothetical protein
MTIIVQRNRILVKGFNPERVQNFVQKQKIMQRKMPIGWEEKWTSILQNVEYKGKNYWAVARQTPPKDITYFLEPEEREVVRDDYFIKPRKMSLKLRPEFKPRDALQEQLVDFLKGGGAYKDLADKPRRAMIADTGEGKTFLTIQDICRVGYVSAILCPDERAIVTWLEEFAKFCDVSEDGSEFFVVQGQDTIPRAVKNKEKIKILLVSERTISAAFQAGRGDDLVNLFEELGVGYKVIDEMHLNITSVFWTEMSIVTEKSLYLTATDKRRVRDEQRVLDQLMPADDCIFRQDPVPKFEFVEVQYYTHPAQEHQKGINKPSGFDALSYLKMLFNELWPYKDFFLLKVLRPSINFCLKKMDPDNRLAIVVKSNEVLRTVAEWAEKEYPDKTVGRFNSDIKDIDERMKEGLKDIVVTTDRSFAGIINIPKLEAIINTTPITSEAHLLQIAGRMRKEEGKKRIFMQLVDYSFKKARSMMQRLRPIIRPVSISESKFVVGKTNRSYDESE